MNINTIITHNGKFHADDVCAVAFLEIVKKNAIIVKRVSESEIPEKIDNDTIIIDIGGGKFDHHEKFEDKERRFSVKRKYGTPYAAFGKVVKYFGHEIMTKKELKAFDREFVASIDAFDNGEGHPNELSIAISSLNPVWDSNESADDCFRKAVETAKVFINAKITLCKSKTRAECRLATSRENQKDGIMVLDTYVPWMNGVRKDTKFVLFPSNREEGYWNVVTIPITPPTSPNRVDFPKEWVGKSKLESLQVQEGMTFCHSSGFMSVFNSFEHAYNGALYAIKEDEKNAVLSE